MNNKQYRLGFVGIGLMGKPLSLRLIHAGFQLSVWNRSTEKLNELRAAGAKLCTTVNELVMASDIIILCLADGEVVSHIVVTEILPVAQADKLIIDLSSIHPETTRQLAAKLYQKAAMPWVDAPVSGGTLGAEQGTLAIMAGGAEADIAIAREVLKPLYSRFTHMGALGTGQMTKICNQMLVTCNVLAIAEMMALAQQAGVDSAKIPEALTGGFADSKPLQIVAPAMANNCFEPIKWRVKTLLKDVNMAVDIAHQTANAIPMSALAAQLLQEHGLKGFLEQDPATLIKLYQKSQLD